MSDYKVQFVILTWLEFVSGYKVMRYTEASGFLLITIKQLWHASSSSSSFWLSHWDASQRPLRRKMLFKLLQLGPL